MNEQEASKSRPHTLNQLLGSNNASVWKLANELKNQGFPLQSIWIIKLEQVIQ